MAELDERKGIERVSKFYAEFATLLSKRIEDANSFFDSQPCFTWAVSPPEGGYLVLDKGSDGWQLFVKYSHNEKSVPAKTACVDLKRVAVSILPEFTHSYLAEMHRRVIQMEQILFPQGREVDARAEGTGH